MILQVSLDYITMTKSSISQYFNPDQHLVLHQDKEGNMIGGGYQVNNLLYQHKMPLFVSLDAAGGGVGRQTGGSGGNRGGGGEEHFIPEKFSDLFKDLAVPAGLFMMPALFRPRNYAFEVPDMDADAAKSHKDVDKDKDKDKDKDADDTDSESESDSDDEHHKTKMVPNDIFDMLLSLVTPTERIQHDVKTRRQRQMGGGGGGGGGKDKKRQNKTKRAKA
jgi:hypothetical protein